MSQVQTALRQRLKDRTQIEIAKEAGVTQGYLSRVLNGLSQPSDELCEYLGFERIVRVSYRRLQTNGSQAA